MKLSHSKLNCILSCPMTYYLKYIQGISLKEKPAALAIGSAVHWGIEHNTEDLEEYTKTTGTLKQSLGYSKEQLLAESMIHGYFKHKNEIFDQILTYNEKKLKLIEEQHEIFMSANLDSFKYETPHEFIGIIDLLLKTDEGYIIIDYKTSTLTPNWDDYLEQLYRYRFLLQSYYPDTPLIKIGIINIRKTSIRQKKDENEEEFLRRLRLEYEINDDELVNYHEFDPKELDQKLFDDYIKNLSKMADAAETIDKTGQFYINFGNARTQYGKSEFYDIFFETPGAEILYDIEDKIWNEDKQDFDVKRDCVPTDMSTILTNNILNKYDIFKKEFETIGINMSDTEFDEYLHKKYLCDNNLIDAYYTTLLHDIE